ncbi:DUF4031 domain-containing protein [Pseudoxanthomonas sp.]|uniref:DUF4031 domain-containing protein n=1 Tax=Pseudoxanthomonas sp. TaxID=1871049 RepID=UPI0026238D42|nr:DUF4031 domain-containing protein [Pseudoxanthomonas sp.]WDS36192.1 MAG: DUF4031 domain-containing protein [Pseudoxanthomonas sp.]
MAVYVDNMRAPFGRMIMCHMLADTRQELDAMADRIGVARKWIQKAGTVQEHYDIALSARAKAVAAGAVEIDLRETGHIVKRRREAMTRHPENEGERDGCS